MPESIARDKYDAEMSRLYKELVKSTDATSSSALPIVCPTTFNKPCRLCDLAKTILFKKDNEGTPLRQKASELNRKQSYYSNVIFPTNPSEIVVFQYGFTVWKEMMLFQMGPGSEVSDWLDPKKGRNTIITKTTVGGNKRRTQYSTKARINASPLLDMSVLRKLSQPEYQLDNILELIRDGKVKPFYQSQLQEGPNELRVLPSWLGPEISKFFQLILYHYGISEEEFDLIQRGELNPFSGLDYEVVVPEQGLSAPKPMPISTGTGSIGTKDLWGEYVNVAPKAAPPTTPVAAPATTPPIEPYPPCFGKNFDPNDEECMTDCAQDGWTEACRTAFDALQRTNLEKRKIAKRLVK